MAVALCYEVNLVITEDKFGSRLSVILAGRMDI
jgi:hypothetical protein